MQRRRFLSAALIGMTAKGEQRVAGSFVNDAFPLGHRIRDHAAFAVPKQVQRIPVVIVGGGMAGLSAAWRLNKKGFRDFVVLEMEPQPGGNSRWGENEITPYPWAAHYTPVPNRETVLVRELFEEIGLVTEGKWEERYLCFSPQERLYLHGRWQEGIEPEIAATARDHEDYRRFDGLVSQFRSSGQFKIPMDLGASSSPLDRMSMTQWLDENDLKSPYLRWFIDYSTRDDYGASAKDTSAFAGIHYFAGREHDEKGPLTWPEGNGWILKRLLERVGKFVRPNAVVYSIRREGQRFRVRTEGVEYIAESVIFAAPSFLAPYLIEGAPKPEGFVYSPWLTANLTLSRMPEDNADLAWDNVIYDSPSLGYVVATHMSLRSVIERSVWTYYWALAEGTPSANRELLLQKDWNYWKEAILNDLSRAHPNLRGCVSRIDIMRIGHAMARPVPGFLGSESRKRFAAGESRLFYANSDVSGYSIFEEAQYRGVKAADRALRVIGKG
ncbi:MAG: FAD-dependent oxidoreductase [Bryobacteraceae bacterium]